MSVEFGGCGRVMYVQENCQEHQHVIRFLLFLLKKIVKILRNLVVREKYEFGIEMH